MGEFDLELKLLEKTFTVGDAYFACYTLMCSSKFVLMYAIDVCPIKHFICLYSDTAGLGGEKTHSQWGKAKEQTDMCAIFKNI